MDAATRDTNNKCINNGETRIVHVRVGAEEHMIVLDGIVQLLGERNSTLTDDIKILESSFNRLRKKVRGNK